MIKSKYIFCLGIVLIHIPAASGMDMFSNMFKNMFLKETRECDPTWLECTKLKRHTMSIEKIATLQTTCGKTLIASGGQDNLVCMWDFDFSDKQQHLEYNINSRGVVRNVCLTQVTKDIDGENANLIYLFWVSDVKESEEINGPHIRPIYKYTVHARIYAILEGQLERTTFPDLEFGPYDNYIRCIQAVQPNIIVWYADNMRYELDITSNNPPSVRQAADENNDVSNICVLDQYNIAEQFCHKASTGPYTNFIQIYNRQNNTTTLLHDFGTDYPGMCVCKNGVLVTTTKDGFITWNWAQNQKLQTYRSSDEYLFENCKQYTDNTIISLPSCCKKKGLFIINLDGEIVQHYVSEQLLDIASNPENLSLTDDLIVYTVDDGRHPDHKMFDDVVYVIKRPQV